MYSGIGNEKFGNLSNFADDSTEEIEERMREYELLKDKCDKIKENYANERLIELLAAREKSDTETIKMFEETVKEKKANVITVPKKTRDDPPIVISDRDLKYDIATAGKISDKPDTMINAFGDIVNNWINKDTISTPIGVHDMYERALAKENACIKDSVKNYLNSLHSYSHKFINIVKQNNMDNDAIKPGITKHITEIRFGSANTYNWDISTACNNVAPDTITKIKFVEHICEKYMNDYRLISSTPNSNYKFDGCRFRTIHRCQKCEKNINRPYVVYKFNSYVWDSDLLHYIEEHNMLVDGEFLENINKVQIIEDPENEEAYFEKVENETIDIEKLKANIYGLSGGRKDMF